LILAFVDPIERGLSGRVFSWRKREYKLNLFYMAGHIDWDGPWVDGHLSWRLSTADGRQMLQNPIDGTAILPNGPMRTS